jgi:hypothetical protein
MNQVYRLSQSIETLKKIEKNWRFQSALRFSSAVEKDKVILAGVLGGI